MILLDGAEDPPGFRWLLVLILLDCAELVSDCHVSATVLETDGTEGREREQKGASQAGSQYFVRRLATTVVCARALTHSWLLESVVSKKLLCLVLSLVHPFHAITHLIDLLLSSNSDESNSIQLSSNLI